MNQTGVKPRCGICRFLMHNTLSGVWECRRAACGQPRTAIKRTAVKKRPRRAKPGDDDAYRRWLRENCKCVICANPKLQQKFGMEWLTYVDPDFLTIDPCHTETGGIGIKAPDSCCIPMCRLHHQEQHQIGWKDFEKKYSLDRKREAEVHFAAWRLVGKELA